MAGNTVGAVVAAGDIHKPEGIIALLSQIQRISSVERGGAELPEGYVTMKLKIDYLTAGFKISFFTSLMMGLLMPLAVAVVLGKIPIFGSTSQGILDKAYIILFTISISLSYAFLIGTTLMKCGTPNATKDLISQFLGGYNIGIIFKMVVIFTSFHMLYFLFPEQRIFDYFSSMVANLEKDGFLFNTINQAYQLMVTLHSVLIESAYLTALTGILSIIIVYSYIYIGRKKQEPNTTYKY